MKTIEVFIKHLKQYAVICRAFFDRNYNVLFNSKNCIKIQLYDKWFIYNDIVTTGKNYLRYLGKDWYVMHGTLNRINMKTIEATAFLRPNRRQIKTEICDIYPDDADYIINKAIQVSIENDSVGGYIFYFDYGQKDNEGEPIEHIEFSNDRSCCDTIRSAVERIKARI